METKEESERNKNIVYVVDDNWVNQWIRYVIGDSLPPQEPIGRRILCRFFWLLDNSRFVLNQKILNINGFTDYTYVKPIQWEYFKKVGNLAVVIWQTRRMVRRQVSSWYSILKQEILKNTKSRCDPCPWYGCYCDLLVVYLCETSRQAVIRIRTLSISLFAWPGRVLFDLVWVLIVHHARDASIWPISRSAQYLRKHWTPSCSGALLLLI